MSAPVVINLPRPISTNSLYTNARGKGRVKTKRYCAWLRSAGWHVKAVKPRQITKPCKLHLTIESGYRGDLDNTFKCVQDILETCGVVINDKQFKSISAEFGDVDGCRVEIFEIEKVAA